MIGERTNTGAFLFLYEFVPLTAPPRKIFPKLAQESLLAGYKPPTQAFLGELVFLPSPQKFSKICGEGRNTRSPKNACVGG